jgi:hypothetical protein
MGSRLRPVALGFDALVGVVPVRRFADGRQPPVSSQWIAVLSGCDFRSSVIA